MNDEKSALYLTKSEIERLVSESVAEGIEEGIRRAFRDLGIPSSQDGLDQVKRFRSNMEFVDDWHELCQLVRHKGVATGILMIMSAFGAVIVLGVKGWFGQ